MGGESSNFIPKFSRNHCRGSEVGPGLALCLAVGVEKALAFAAEHQKPVIKVTANFLPEASG